MGKKLSCNKKGLSGIITAVIMIALVMAAAGIVWGIVSGTINKQVKSAQSCFGNFDKVTLNKIYTCVQGDKDVQVSINIGDIDVEKVVVSISAEENVKGYEITNTATAVPGLYPYPSTSGDIELPGKNEGKTYIATGFSDTPDLIQIAPVINGQQCDASDYVSEVGSC